jgi:IclR family pca regulon transcriptional regulator
MRCGDSFFAADAADLGNCKLRTQGQAAPARQAAAVRSSVSLCDDRAMPQMKKPSPHASPLVKPAIAKADMIEGMAKGMAVLESFDTQRQRLNATLAAERAGITRAAARRHLLTLHFLGYLETDGSYFWLSAKVLRFSGSYLATARLPRAVQPTLNRLAAQAQESFSVAVLDGEEVVIIGRSGFEWKSAADGKSAPSRVLAYGLHLGARLPAHATSTGRVLLAAKTKTEVNVWLKDKSSAGGLPRLTLHTVTDAGKFKLVIDQVRLDDYCMASEEHELGVHALAVPLRNMQGQTVAALNVVCSAQRLSVADMRRDLLPLLLDAARELRALL